MKVTQTIEIFTIKSSFICLSLFHMHMYMNFVSIISKAMSKQYITIAFCTISWIWIKVMGISLLPVHTLTVLSPHTMIPQTPPCNVKENQFLVTDHCLELELYESMACLDASFEYNVLLRRIFPFFKMNYKNMSYHKPVKNFTE